ncbi:MAG: penicillin-binding protein activator [Gammaproteobacteria bacterium]|jgi:hypothetical protein
MLHRPPRHTQTLPVAAALALLLTACVPGLQREPPPDPALVARETLASARDALRAGRPDEALQQLAGLPAASGDPEAALILALRGDAAFAARRPAEGVAALVARESLLVDPAQRAANQRRLWNRMQEATAAGVSLETPPDATPTVAAWLELGRLAAASGGNLFDLRQGLQDWLAAHPAHPAADGLVRTLLAEYRAMTEFPRQVALLLPLSGRQAASTAVRDGFVAGYLQHEGEAERPAVVTYDTAALGAVAAYEMAVRNGAEFIVGPLLKSELAELAAAELPAVPGLALNWTDSGALPPGYVAQFALAPEDEAAAAAERALLEGHRRALVLGENTGQGQRTAESFIAAFQQGGGEVLAWQVFDPRNADFSYPIRALLLLDESGDRHQRIQRILGRGVEFEPRRRHDGDFIFLAARASDALLLRPQLRFHYAGRLPVYSTSQVYDATRADNSDLDGIMFADMPWRVNPFAAQEMAAFSAFGDAAVARNGRLYAFGADAYRLLPLLYHGSPALAQGVPGLTGTLTIDGAGRIRRALDWGRFAGGEVEHDPQPLPATEPTEDETVIDSTVIAPPVRQ